jgi:hypothetical protein
MDIKTWKDQCDAVRMRIANEKRNLVDLIKTRASEILEKEGTGKFIQCDGSEWILGLDTQGENIVAWGDGIYSDLIDLTVDELLEIVGSLYWDNFEAFDF